MLRSRSSHLELRHQPPRLQVEEVLVGTESPLHHLLVVKLKLNITARRNVDLRVEGLQVLGVSPMKEKRFSWSEGRSSVNTRVVVHLTMPAALFLEVAWAYSLLATVFSFTEPTNVMPFTFLQREQEEARVPSV